MIIKCTCCNGTGHNFTDEGRIEGYYACQCCQGYGEVEVEDEDDDCL